MVYLYYDEIERLTTFFPDLPQNLLEKNIYGASNPRYK